MGRQGYEEKAQEYAAIKATLSAKILSCE